MFFPDIPDSSNSHFFPTSPGFTTSHIFPRSPGFVISYLYIAGSTPDMSFVNLKSCLNMYLDVYSYFHSFILSLPKQLDRVASLWSGNITPKNINVLESRTEPCSLLDQRRLRIVCYRATSLIKLLNHSTDCLP